MQPRCYFVAIACCGILPSAAAHVQERSLASPNEKNVFVLERDDTTGRFAWSVTRDGRPVVTRGALGIDVTGFGTIADEGTISKADARAVNTIWKPPYGERATVPDRFREETLTLTHASHRALATVKVQVRAYDEGVALRYLIEGSGTLTMTGDKTSFPLPADTQVWAAQHSQAGISKVAIGSMGGGVERPLTAELASDLFVALGEAGSLDHARMKFSRTGPSTIVPALGGGSTFTGSLTTPWRFVRIAGSATGLLESNHLMWNLSEPSRIGDTSWLRPGKILREITLTTDGGIASVDWAAAHGLDFIHLDAGWYGREENPASDATGVNVDPARSPGPLDLQAVIKHAKSKNVGVILYVNRRALERQLDELLPLYKKWGVAGIKFGFVNTGSQQWTKWLHESIEKCAQHQLMVNVHDDYRMTGTERTLPNFMTSEGIRGDEETPPNEVVLRTLFTRCLAGAGDQTNCYFAPRVTAMGSHASQLAKSVCIYSPWQYLYWYDSPANAPQMGQKASVLQDVPELSFFKRLPTVWDETRWLQGHPESHAVVARRKRDTWFIGGLNGAAAREFEIPLDFLPANQNFRLELYRDDNTVATVTKVKIGVSVVNRDTVIHRKVGVRKGIAAILTPTTDAITPPDVDPPPPPLPPLPPGTIKFETSQGYPAANAEIAAVHRNPGGSPFSGAKGWALSTADSPGRVLATGDSGDYAGGQALGSNGKGTYIGGLKGAIEPAAAHTISFDARYHTGISVAFMRDADGDGRFDPGETGMSFGVGGATAVRFQHRAANSGTETASPLAGTNGHWYRFRITIGDSVEGKRAITMAVRNLSTQTDLDFELTTAGTQPWSFSVTDADFGPAPETADGVFVRLTGSAKVDNLRATAAGASRQIVAD
jgi:alpha-glucosidase